MLDEKDIEKIQSMIDQAKDDMLKQSAANTRVIIESSVMKKLDLLIEGQQSLLDTPRASPARTQNTPRCPPG